MPRATLDTSREAFFALVVGASGTGKTHWLKERLADWSKVYPRIVIADPRGQFKDVRPAVGIDTLGRWLHSGASGIRNVWARSVAERKYIGELVWLFGDVLLIADEFSRYAAGSKFRWPVWDRIVEEGRSYGISLVATTQRPTMIPVIVRANMTDVTAFRCRVKADAQWVSEFTGTPTADLLAMPRYECVTAGEHPDLIGGGNGSGT